MMYIPKLADTKEITAVVKVGNVQTLQYREMPFFSSAFVSLLSFSRFVSFGVLLSTFGLKAKLRIQITP